jgi:hypothetical protein
MDSKSYLVLNAWLQTSDRNYLSGRFLWINFLHESACNLLWLSCEQIIKILIIQEKVDSLCEGCNTLDEVHTKIDFEGKKLGHNVKDLISKIKAEHPDLNITKYQEVLEKLQEYFYRRYVVHRSSSIAISLLGKTDELYFCLRKIVAPDIGLGLIDEVFIQKKHGWRHPVKSFAFAYHKNNFFAPRKHRKVNLIGPDNKTYEEDGTK